MRRARLPTRVPGTRAEPDWQEIRRRVHIVYQRGRRAWDALTPDERRELRDLVGKSRGRPRNLTAQERRRLGYLAGKAGRAAASPSR